MVFRYVYGARIPISGSYGTLHSSAHVHPRRFLQVRVRCSGLMFPHKSIRGVLSLSPILFRGSDASRVPLNMEYSSKCDPSFLDAIKCSSFRECRGLPSRWPHTIRASSMASSGEGFYHSDTTWPFLWLHRTPRLAWLSSCHSEFEITSR